MVRKYKLKWLWIVSAVALILEGLIPFVAAPVHAANSLTNTYVRLDRMATGTTTSLRVVFKTSATNGTEAKVAILLPSFTVNAVQSVSSASCAADTGATALPGSLTAAGSGTTITISSVNDLSVSTAYCVDLTSSSAVTTPASGQYTATVKTQTAAPADIDTIDVALRVVANDQITVNASVPPTFNMTFGANTDTIPTINSGTASGSTGVGITFATNAANGWTAWVKSLNSGLKSAVAGNYTITSTSVATVHTLGPSTDDYGMSAAVTTDSGVGVPSITSYNGNGTTTAAGVDGTYRKFASSTGTAAGDIITVKEVATAGGETPAANDYTDKLTIIGAATF